MNRNFYVLLLAQFLSAFADNAILFTAIAMAMQESTPAWYVPALQASFIVTFVILAPWVGPFADAHPKALVLIIANGVKAVGAGLLLADIEPLLSYAVVGVGAAMYSPAKYGILPELVPHGELVRANGWVEGTTILAILAGSWIGAKTADQSVLWALVIIFATYAVSALIALFITRAPAHPPTSSYAKGGTLSHFAHVARTLLADSRASFTVLGTSLFWAAAAVLRLMLVAWAPVVLLTTNTADIAELTLAIAVGIAFGALLAPRLIPIEHLRRTRLAACLLGACILGLSLTHSLWPARLALLAIGVAGGLYVVPINAVLQEIGHRSIGSGGAVAVQNFSENLAMLATTGLYTLAVAQGAEPVISIASLGILIIVVSLFVSRRLPPDSAIVREADLLLPPPLKMESSELSPLSSKES